MRPFSLFTIALFPVLFCLCSGPALVGGTSSSENARLTGTIVDTAGAPAPGASVLLIPAALNPAENTADTAIVRDTTGDDGAYSFSEVAPGAYNIQAASTANGTSLLITGIELDKKDTLDVSAGTLKQPGSIVIALAPSADTAGVRIYLPGTTLYREVPAHSTSVTFNEVPSGTIPSILLSGPAVDSAVTLGSNIAVVSSDTTFLNFSAKLLLNTSGAGANVPGPVLNFPLLVRLNATDFDFSQFRPDGSDIRFSKADGTPLKFEIAQWDAALKQAAVWVSIDTVYGNSAAQYITISWGITAAGGASNSFGVFDTANGFAGVWHLEEGTATMGAINVFKDETQNQCHGTNYIASVDRNGVAGNGRNINGTDYIFVNKPNFQMAGRDFSIALWVNLRRERGALFSKDTAVSQDSCARRLYLGDAPADSNGLHPSFGGKASGAAVSTSALTLNAWHHVAFTWDNATAAAAIYVDGVKTALGENTFVSTCADNARDRLIFGYDGTYTFGFLDEIHISRTARSGDWMKLSYENQRPDQILVTVSK